jgi:LmbE family N-acetylglucosaminyl deacetylase
MRRRLAFVPVLLILAVSASAAEPTLDALLDSGARLMWVGAHPDDESFAGPILAKTTARGGAVRIVVLTRGEGGACEIKDGCPPDLATVRAREIAQVARGYRASLSALDFPNAPLPAKGARFPRREVVAHAWEAHGDPARRIAAIVREFRPDALVTFAPDWGATSHPEHQLASRYATAAARLAADASADVPGATYRVPRTYYLLVRNWLTRLLGRADPLAPTETFDTDQDCAGGTRCKEIAAELARVHRSQQNDMGAMRVVILMSRTAFLRRVDPFAEIAPPTEPEKR